MKENENDIGMAFPVFENAMKLIKRGTDLNMREVSSNKIVLENDEFVIEIKHKRRADNEIMAER
jgi:hypothetical protein